MSKRTDALNSLKPFAQAILELEPDLKRLDRIDNEEKEGEARIVKLKASETAWAARVEERRVQLAANAEAAKAELQRLKDDSATVMSDARQEADRIKQAARDAAKKVQDDMAASIASARQQHSDEKSTQASELAAAKKATKAQQDVLAEVNREIAARQSVLDDAKEKLKALG